MAEPRHTTWRDVAAEASIAAGIVILSFTLGHLVAPLHASLIFAGIGIVLVVRQIDKVRSARRERRNLEETR